MYTFKHIDKIKVANMGTEQLKEILSSDEALLLDGDVILYICELLDGRGELPLLPIDMPQTLYELLKDYVSRFQWDCLLCQITKTPGSMAIV